VKERREVEDFFDRLQYMKSRKLLKKGYDQKNPELVHAARTMGDKTIAGLDPYGDPFRIVSALPSRERPYFMEFTGAPDAQKQDIEKYVPDNLKDIYQAQWDKKLSERIEEGQIEGSESELNGMRSEINNRREQMRARRKAEMYQFMDSEN